jgi:carbon monoxide dehydrogenase subunit G
MKLEHSFEVALPPQETFELLLDVPRIAHCMPGASLEAVEGSRFTGTVRVKLGPISITYAGVADIVERDTDRLRAVIDARGKDARGAGEAKATIEAELHPTDLGTRVDVVTDLAVTGKPAQFGRGLMVDVGRKIIGQFAAALAADIEATGNSPATPALAVPAVRVGSAPESAGTAPANAAAETGNTYVPSPSRDQPPLRARSTPDEIDLLGLVGDRVPAKLALALVLAALTVGWVLGRSTAGSRRD